MDKKKKVLLVDIVGLVCSSIGLYCNYYVWKNNKSEEKVK